jgi:hypothetical protein
MRQGGRHAVPRWFLFVAWLLAAVTLARALLLQYVVTPDTFWSLLKIALAFAAFALVARFVSGLGEHRVPALKRTLALAVPIAVVAAARSELGTPEREVLATALSAFVGGIAGAVLGEMLNARDVTGGEGDGRKA